MLAPTSESEVYMNKLKAALRKLSFRTHSWIAAVSCLIGCILGWVGSASGYIWMCTIGIVILVLAVVYSILAFRCPYCDTYINTRGGFPNYCPHCGNELDK